MSSKRTFTTVAVGTQCFSFIGHFFDFPCYNKWIGEHQCATFRGGKTILYGIVFYDPSRTILNLHVCCSPECMVSSISDLMERKTNPESKKKYCAMCNKVLLFGRNDLKPAPVSPGAVMTAVANLKNRADMPCQLNCYCACCSDKCASELRRVWETNRNVSHFDTYKVSSYKEFADVLYGRTGKSKAYPNTDFGPSRSLVPASKPEEKRRACKACLECGFSCAIATICPGCKKDLCGTVCLKKHLAKSKACDEIPKKAALAKKAEEEARAKAKAEAEAKAKTEAKAETEVEAKAKAEKETEAEKWKSSTAELSIRGPIPPPLQIPSPSLAPVSAPLPEPLSVETLYHAQWSDGLLAEEAEEGEENFEEEFSLRPQAPTKGLGPAPTQSPWTSKP